MAPTRGPIQKTCGEREGGWHRAGRSGGWPRGGQRGGAAAPRERRAWGPARLPTSRGDGASHGYKMHVMGVEMTTRAVGKTYELGDKGANSQADGLTELRPLIYPPCASFSFRNNNTFGLGL